MHTTSLTNYGRRSFLLKAGKAGLLAGIGLTANEMLRQTEARRIFDDGMKSLTRTTRRAATEVGHVANSPKLTSRKPLPPLSGEAEYGAYLESLELRYISNTEVFSAHRRRRNGVHNTLPPEEMWDRIAPALKLADELRNRLGVKLSYIASAYRCADYNEQCPGTAKFSQHMENRALDLVFDCPPRDAFTEARKMRDEGKFRGGLGLYPSFIHLDTRGKDATWGA